MSRCLANEVRKHLLFGDRLRDARLFASLDALEEPSHIAAEFAHNLYAFFVLEYVFGTGAVNHVPVARGHQGLLRVGGVLVQCVEGGAGACAASRCYCGGGLEKQFRFGEAVEPVEEHQYFAAGGGVVDRRTIDYRVGGLQDFLGFVDDGVRFALEHAAPDKEDFGFDACGVEFACDNVQCGVGAALFATAAIKQDDFHDKFRCARFGYPLKDTTFTKLWFAFLVENAV